VASLAVAQVDRGQLGPHLKAANPLTARENEKEGQKGNNVGDSEELPTTTVPPNKDAEMQDGPVGPSTPTTLTVLPGRESDMSDLLTLNTPPSNGAESGGGGSPTSNTTTGSGSKARRAKDGSKLKAG
jgi:hypothetical protein